MLNKEDQKKICKEAAVDFEHFQEAIKKRDVNALNKYLAQVTAEYNVLSFASTKEDFGNIEKTKTRQLMSQFMQDLKQMIQRAKTQGKFNNKQSGDIEKLKAKPGDIEKLFAKMKKHFGDKAVCKLLENDENQANQVIKNNNQKTSKKTIEVKFKDETETTLYVNNKGIYVDKSQITEKTIPNIVKTVEAMGLKEVNVNKAAFPKENGDVLYKQLCKELKDKDITVLDFQAAEEKQQENNEKAETKSPAPTSSI